jgi:hypothetical protein
MKKKPLSLLLILLAIWTVTPTANASNIEAPGWLRISRYLEETQIPEYKFEGITLATAISTLQRDGLLKVSVSIDGESSKTIISSTTPESSLLETLLNICSAANSLLTVDNQGLVIARIESQGHRKARYRVENKDLSDAVSKIFSGKRTKSPTDHHVWYNEKHSCLEISVPSEQFSPIHEFCLSLGFVEIIDNNPFK